MPLIDIQRRMAEVGRIRAGDKGDKGQPRKLAHWRLTSKDQTRITHASQLFGGEPHPWEGHDGEWELYTTTAALPIMLLPGHPPTSWYELWSKGGCLRRCDGQHELISDSQCLCGADKECKPTTRLSVLLPDIPGLGSWLLSSTGWNAAAELAGAADLLHRATAQGVLIPARLRLEQRTSISGGQTRKFAVPVIDIDVSFRDLLGGEFSPDSRQLPAGYTPLTETSNGPTLAQGLEIAHTQQHTRTPRSSAPIPVITEDPVFDVKPITVPVDQTPAATLDEEIKTPTKAKMTKLDLLVVEMRDASQINTEQLWSAVANLRNIDVETMSQLLEGRDELGDLHWGPLRKTLTRTEADSLIDRLQRYKHHIEQAEQAKKEGS